MSTSDLLWQQHLAAFADPARTALLSGIQRGLEKECLRVTPQGKLADTPHPLGLGSALTHPQITTDYSEALLEFITAPHDNIPSLLGELAHIHRYTYSQLSPQNERLWPSSMPSHLPADGDIPVARYGSSNSGTMKTLYRIGLGHRYGRSMQTIAGVHYNFSLPDSFWSAYQTLLGATDQSLQDFKTERYFALIRNFRRQFWVLVYLFGASPAVSRCFVQGRPHKLQEFPSAKDTFYLPFATSLRMGDLGYQSDAQKTLHIDYNRLGAYLKTLCNAITTPWPAYESIGVKDESGDYKQLNTSLLQIENEFYSSIRPKRTTQRGETALQALRFRGVEYIEVRCVDLNPYEPLGVTADQLRVMDAFLVQCALSDSPETTEQEFKEAIENQQRIVNRGREPFLRLERGGEDVDMVEWANQILSRSAEAAKLLDKAYGGQEYEQAVSQQFAKLTNAHLTPSARVLNDLAQGKDFYQHTLDLAEKHRQYFEQQPLPVDEQAIAAERAAQSQLDQSTLEASDTLSFDDYLAAYYDQYRCCQCDCG